MSKRKSRELPTQARLQELFDYRDGELYHRKSRGRYARIGHVAGSCANGQRVLIGVDKNRFLASRLIWVWHFGCIPAGMEVNRINGDKSDNKIQNLRLASHTEVARCGSMRRNNTSGFKGVSFCKSTKRWAAVISVNYRNVFLGRFDTKEEAHAAYCAAADKYFGKFANFGTPRQYVRPPQKDAPPSSGQMTEGAGTTGRDTMAQGANEANHSVALTDQAPALQVPEHSAHRAAKRQTEVMEDVTGTRFCKRCAGHRKSNDGTYLSDVIIRYWVCQACSEGYHTQRASCHSAEIKSDAGRAQT